MLHKESVLRLGASGPEGLERKYYSIQFYSKVWQRPNVMRWAVTSKLHSAGKYERNGSFGIVRRARAARQSDKV
jgi:hypothetical protein